jgi:hypothetical protein
MAFTIEALMSCKTIVNQGRMVIPAIGKKGDNMNHVKIDDRLGAVMEEAARIKAERLEDQKTKKKPIKLTVNFNEIELDRLRAKADASCMNLQDYIRYILSTYA